MSELAANDYPSFLVEIKARIRRAQYRALRATNKELLELYWDIGESIHRKQENAPIGIICRDKNKTVVEYAWRTAGRPIGVATDTVVSQLPEAYRDQLPSPEAIAGRLRVWNREDEASNE